MWSLMLWLFWVQMGLSKAFPDTGNIGSLEPRQDEETRNTPTTPSTQNVLSPKERDEELPATKSYRVLVTDTFNEAQIKETRTWLEGITKDKSKMHEMEVLPFQKADGWDEDEFKKWWHDGVYDPDVFNHTKVDGWFGVILDSAGYDTVSKKKEWVRAVHERRSVEFYSPVPEPKPRKVENLKSRKFGWGDWDKQEDADRDLCQDSAYEFGDFTWMDDYVYEKRAGKDVLVYVVDEGVSVDVKNEKGNLVFPTFDDPNDNSGIVQTQAFKALDPPANNPRLDHNTGLRGHGTTVASKVVGQHGTAKGAILVPVQVVPGDESDLLNAFREILDDYSNRQKAKADLKAVIVMSSGLGRGSGQPGFTREEAERDVDGIAFTSVFNMVFSAGIPVVLASGNHGNDPNRHAIDVIPQVLEKEDFPVINVGAATLEGKAWPKTQGQGSQDGTQLTIYGVGENVGCHDHNDGPKKWCSGTSVAAPAVAGIIALHMIYEPWDKSKVGKERVKEIKKFIRTSESSWQRNQRPNPDNPDMEVNMIWNGADKAAHEKVDEDTTEQPPPPQNQNEGRTFVVGLEQVGTPRCITHYYGNNWPSTSCSAQHDYKNSYFFYRLENNVAEVESLCTSMLSDFHQDDQGATNDENLFENPTWPKGEWELELFGEKYFYRNDGQTSGGLFKGDRKIDCDGDLRLHDPKSDEWCENTLTKEDGVSRKRRRLLGCKW